MRREHSDWVRLPSPPESPELSGAGMRASRIAIAVLPTAAALVVLRRRARRRASQVAWRQRTHAEVSAENQRMVDAHESGDRDASSGRRAAGPQRDRTWHPLEDRQQPD